MRPLRIILCLAIACPSIVLARGRRPDDDADNFPDYNKLEMRPRPRTPQISSSTATDTSAPSTPMTSPPAPPALNTPLKPAAEEETAPQPPPKAVPMPDDSSEPPLPQDIKDTLMPAATGQ